MKNRNKVNKFLKILILLHNKIYRLPIHFNLGKILLIELLSEVLLALVFLYNTLYVDDCRNVYCGNFLQQIKTNVSLLLLLVECG